MKKILFLFIAGVGVFFANAAKADDRLVILPPLSVADMGNYTEVETTQGWLGAVQSIRLCRRGERVVMGECIYLVATTDGGLSFIFGSIEDGGNNVSFKVFDINGDGKSELLVFYMRGSSSYRMEVYSISEHDAQQLSLTKWKDSVVSEYFKKIDVEKGTIVVKTLEDGPSECIYTYAVKGTSILQVGKREIPR